MIRIPIKQKQNKKITPKKKENVGRRRSVGPTEILPISPPDSHANRQLSRMGGGEEGGGGTGGGECRKRETPSRGNPENKNKKKRKRPRRRRGEEKRPRRKPAVEGACVVLDGQAGARSHRGAMKGRGSRDRDFGVCLIRDLGVSIMGLDLFFYGD